MTANLSTVLPPTAALRGRAWERAWVLTQEYAERLAGAENDLATAIVIAAPDRLGWPEIGQMTGLYRRHVALRT